MNIQCYVPVTLLLERWLHIEVVEDVAKAFYLPKKLVLYASYSSDLYN